MYIKSCSVCAGLYLLWPPYLVRFILQVIHILFRTGTYKDRQRCQSLQLHFFFTKKRKLLNVEILRQNLYRKDFWKGIGQGPQG